jgi:cyclophilin family peptidyl-prolyl cis-trans isomerase
MKNILAMVFLLLILGGIVWLASSKTPTPTTTQSVTPVKKEEAVSNFKFPGILSDEKIKNKKAIVKTSKGTIEFNLYSDRAPKTVSNFVYLAELGYYNDLIFHRVEPGFVIQGGDPTGTGAGGPGYKFEDETVVGDYKAGTVAMANAGPDTNGSQFFICIEDQPSLPKLYNLFGQVTVGLDIVEKIQRGDKIESVTIVNQ